VEQKRIMNYQDVYVVDTFEEAEQFRYKHNEQPVEIGTAVAYDVVSGDDVVLTCFDGIYYDPDTATY
jgi:hypothetical protein